MCCSTFYFFFNLNLCCNEENSSWLGQVSGTHPLFEPVLFSARARARACVCVGVCECEFLNLLPDYWVSRKNRKSMREPRHTSWSVTGVCSNFSPFQCSLPQRWSLSSQALGLELRRCLIHMWWININERMKWMFSSACSSFSHHKQILGGNWVKKRQMLLLGHL